MISSSRAEATTRSVAVHLHGFRLAHISRHLENGWGQVLIARVQTRSTQTCSFQWWSIAPSCATTGAVVASNGGATARYIVLNPVRAGLCAHPSEWRWSSYRATAGLEPPPPFLTIDWLLDQLSRDRARAHARYTAFVELALDDPILPEAIGELYVGTQRFARDAHPPPPYSLEIPTRQKRATRPSLDQLFSTGADDEIGAAVHLHGYLLAEVARHLQIHPSTVTRRLRVFEAAMRDVAERRQSRPDP